VPRAPLAVHIFLIKKKTLKAHPQIITGTPGRLADLVRLGFLDLKYLEFLVLDEADRLFSHEYSEPLEFLLSAAPSSCVRVMASATIPARVREKHNHGSQTL